MKRYQQVLEVLSTGEATTPEIAAALGQDPRKTRDAVHFCVKKGLVEYISCDGKKNRKWRLVSKAAPKAIRERPAVVQKEPAPIVVRRPRRDPSRGVAGDVFGLRVAIRETYEVVL